MADEDDDDSSVATLVLYAAGIALLIALLFLVPDIVAWLMLRR